MIWMFLWGDISPVLQANWSKTWAKAAYVIAVLSAISSGTAGLRR